MLTIPAHVGYIPRMNCKFCGTNLKSSTRGYCDNVCMRDRARLNFLLKKRTAKKEAKKKT